MGGHRLAGEVMDSDFGVDIAEAVRGIKTAEVICILLPLVARSLVVDTRYDHQEGPFVQVMTPAGSLEERVEVLRKLRPRFPEPRRIAVLPWPGYVQGLCRVGLWDKLVQRFVDSAHPAAVKACEAAFNEIVELERQELARAIRGEHYRVLWQRGA